jgi:hypothetical protein
MKQSVYQCSSPQMQVGVCHTQLQKPWSERALLLNMVEGDSPRCVQRPVFVRQQLRGILVQSKP